MGSHYRVLNLICCLSRSLQEPKNDKDTEYCKKVNDNLNNPPTPGSSRGGGLPSELSGLGRFASGWIGFNHFRSFFALINITVPLRESVKLQVPSP